MEREFTCIICPNGCLIKVEYDECPKGKDYVKNEISNPLRVFTGSVLVAKGDFSLVSVKTPSPIPKKYLKKVGEITRRIKVEAPVEIGQIIAFNLLDENIDLVAPGTFVSLLRKLFDY